MYLNAVSTAIVTITASGPEALGEAVRPDDVRPGRDTGEDSLLVGEPPGHRHRLVVGDRLEQVDAIRVPVRGDHARPALDRERPALAPPMAAEPVGSWPWMTTPRGRSASDTPISELPVPMPWQKAVTLPALCSQISRPSWSRWPGMMYGLLNWSVA